MPSGCRRLPRSTTSIDLEAVTDIEVFAAENLQEPPPLAGRTPWIIPIPGTSNLHRLDASLAAADIELTPDDLNEIDTAGSKIQVHGLRGTGDEQYG